MAWRFRLFNVLGVELCMAAGSEGHHLAGCPAFMPSHQSLRYPESWICVSTIDSGGYCLVEWESNIVVTLCLAEQNKHVRGTL